MRLLREHSAEYKVALWSYTLMTNHIHAIVVPASVTALSDVFRNAHSVYGRWFNKKYGLSGHLWQGRFYSCVMSESHLWAGVRYVERNPVRAGIVRRAEDYRWSSPRAHVYGSPDPLLDAGLPQVRLVGDWSQWLAANDADSEIKAIRKATAKDYPFAEDPFVKRLELELGRPLRPQKVGRKKQQPGNETQTAQTSLILVEE
jgi:putative transposase